MPVLAETSGPAAVFEWKRWPEADLYVDGLIEKRFSTTVSRPSWPLACRAKRGRVSRTGSITW